MLNTVFIAIFSEENTLLQMTFFNYSFFFIQRLVALTHQVSIIVLANIRFNTYNFSPFAYALIYINGSNFYDLISLRGIYYA